MKQLNLKRFETLIFHWSTASKRKRASRISLHNYRKNLNIFLISVTVLNLPSSKICFNFAVRPFKCWYKSSSWPLKKSVVSHKIRNGIHSQSLVALSHKFWFVICIQNNCFRKFYLRQTPNRYLCNSYSWQTVKLK